jgi:hypothetical protein
LKDVDKSVNQGLVSKEDSILNKSKSESSLGSSMKAPKRVKVKSKGKSALDQAIEKKR